MKKVSKLCAMALAAAMAVSFATPISAKASYYDINKYANYGMYQTYYDVDRSVDYKTNQDGTLTPTTKTVTYKNKVTGETCVVDANGKVISGDSEKARKSYDYGIPKKITIGTDEYVDYNVVLRAGEKVKSFKVKNGKGCVSIKKAGMSVDDTYGRNSTRHFEGQDYYNGYSYDSGYAPSKTQVYNYAYRLGGRKVGTSVLELKVKDGAGLIKTLDIKVIVTNDNRVFKSLSYAGKSLLIDGNRDATNNKILYAQTKNKRGIEYTKKKSGKFKVKMGDNYKFVAAYVVKPNGYVPKTETRKSGTGYTRTTTSLERAYSRGIDLNGDGDYEDTINGIDENDFSGSSVQKIGKSAKITLNTVADQTNYTSYYTNNRTGEISDYESSYTNGNYAYTVIYIVYQNKVTKGVSYMPIPIILRVGN
ncbi:MAG: hypothetical protein K6G06_03335 [Butyrivibrio sp.]|nr:hypothetical protein [Butyrivibrio sp.]